MADQVNQTSALRIGIRNRISTLLLSILAITAVAVLAGLATITTQLFGSRTQIEELRNLLLPRLVKLSQLSQEAAASIAIAPALSTNPTRFEFETLLSRIEDKRNSQTSLLGELAGLIDDPEALDTLKRNSALLSTNQTALTSVVRRQIHVRKRLEKHHRALRKLARVAESDLVDSSDPGAARSYAHIAMVGLLAVLHDPVRARFSRNRRKIRGDFDRLRLLMENSTEDALATQLLSYWSKQGDRIVEDKATELTNAFKIKALVEENSLIANRLLNSANSEFMRANTELTGQIGIIASTAQSNLVAMVLVFVAFAAGAFLLVFVLHGRVFNRLDNLRDALSQFANNRTSNLKDEVPDEIGEISRAINDYMSRIDRQEEELQAKTKDLERLSSRLAKYLSPQVYESIFAGRQQVAVSSSRKKLTVFFSDLVGFTELADQLESEELTQLLNAYLTEMSRIALEFGATIDKFVGDAILVFFGDPETKGAKQDALQCVNMAVAMRDHLSRLNNEWKRSGLTAPLACRIGIHTGYCTVGNFGSSERMDYTIIGGTVNTASRLESVAAAGEILISYETFALVEDEIDCEERGRIDVKGMAYPIDTYAVLQRHGSVCDSDLPFREARTGLLIEISAEAMRPDERAAAVKVLERAIRHIKD
ncbi:MAG: adenylate/guanylate cyclase domain-containing protein [Hyphomicrobiaceae bacterium]